MTESSTFVYSYEENSTDLGYNDFLQKKHTDNNMWHCKPRIVYLFTY